MKILIVDDASSARIVLADIVSELVPEEIHHAGSLAEARQIIASHAVDLALVDIRLTMDSTNRDGIRLIEELRANTRTISIVVSGLNEAADIVDAVKRGAAHYILKETLHDGLLVPAIRELLAKRDLEDELRKLRARAPEECLNALVGISPAMEHLREMICRVAPNNRPVLVMGPTGSGKELVVRAIHSLGAHAEEPLLDLNCGAIPEALVESQLFGHERGAFTGADRKREGYFAAVRRGTLFLDEIAELPPLLQAKLLRVLESSRFHPVGSTADQAFSGRIVAATHANLPERVEQQRFRSDLFYRLNVLTITVPSLAERVEDLPSLVAHFAGRQHRPMRFSPQALELLAARKWNGNVRELRNLVDRLAVFSDDDLITPQTLETIEGTNEAPGGDSAPPLKSMARMILRMPVPNKLAAIEDALVAEAMELAGFNKTAAARLLGVHRKVVERRLEREDTTTPD